MGEILVGVAALVIILVMLRLYVGADPKAMAGSFRHIGATVLGLAAIVALLTGRIAPAVFLLVLVWAVFSGGRLWPAHWTARRRPAPVFAAGPMTRREALDVLGLSEGASESDVHEAHRRLMQQYHPDHGGSDYLASKINQARDILLGT